MLYRCSLSEYYIEDYQSIVMMFLTDYKEIYTFIVMMFTYENEFS